MDSQLRTRCNLHCLYAFSVAHSWKSISSFCTPIVIYIIFGRSQLHARGNSKSILFFALSCALMPDWRIKEHQEDKYSPGNKNPGNKHARLEHQILETNMPGWKTKSWKQTCQSWPARLWSAPLRAIPLFRRLCGMTCIVISPPPEEKNALPFEKWNNRGSLNKIKHWKEMKTLNTMEVAY